MLQRSLSRCARMLRRFSHLIRFAIPMSIAVVLLGAGLLAGRIGLVRAEEAAVAPDAPGSISGVVRDQNGTPLSGIRVDLYILSYQAWLRARQTTTTADGTYTFSPLTTRNYRIGVVDPAQVHAVRFFPNAYTVGEAQSIPVAGNSVTSIDVRLQPAGTVAGTLFITPTMTYLSGVVTALRQQAGQWQEMASTTFYSPTLAAPITYTVVGLNPGVYRVCVASYQYLHSAGGGFPTWQSSECYDDIGTGIDYAKDITVTGGVTIPNIDFMLGDAPDLASISGRITVDGGAALSGATVNLMTQDPLYPGSWQMADTLLTDSNGFYAFRQLKPMTYTLAFIDRSNTYISEYYSNSISLERATPVQVGRFEKRMDIDGVLDRGGTISGKISVLGEKPGIEATVSIWKQPPSNTSFLYPLQTLSDPQSGAYRFGGLPSGSYLVGAYYLLDRGSFMFNGFYGGQSYESAQPVTVTAPLTVANIDIDLGQGQFEGVIDGIVTSHGASLANIQVTLYTGDSYSPAFFTTTTGIDGRYSIGGLLDRGYFIGFQDPAGIYISEYYTNAVSRDSASFLFVTGGNSPVHADADLALTGSISGAVFQLDGSPAPNIDVSALSIYGTPVNTPSVTDAAGKYTMTGLRPDKYIVRFIDTANPFTYSFYHQRLYMFEADLVEVTDGTVTTGIDHIIGGAPTAIGHSPEPDAPTQVRQFLPLIAR